MHLSDHFSFRLGAFHSHPRTELREGGREGGGISAHSPRAPSIISCLVSLATAQGEREEDDLEEEEDVVQGGRDGDLHPPAKEEEDPPGGGGGGEGREEAREIRKGGPGGAARRDLAGAVVAGPPGLPDLPEVVLQLGRGVRKLER